MYASGCKEIHLYALLVGEDLQEQKAGLLGSPGENASFLPLCIAYLGQRLKIFWVVMTGGGWEGERRSWHLTSGGQGCRGRPEGQAGPGVPSAEGQKPCLRRMHL